MQFLTRELKSRNPPVARRYRWGTRKFTIKGRVTRPSLGFRFEVTYFYPFLATLIPFMYTFTTTRANVIKMKGTRNKRRIFAFGNKRMSRGKELIRITNPKIAAQQNKTVRSSNFAKLTVPTSCLLGAGRQETNTQRYRSIDRKVAPQTMHSFSISQNYLFVPNTATFQSR